jgi:hypothetical protein
MLKKVASSGIHPEQRTGKSQFLIPYYPQLLLLGHPPARATKIENALANVPRQFSATIYLHRKLIVWFRLARSPFAAGAFAG